jgi:hypothetical protein
LHQIKSAHGYIIGIPLFASFGSILGVNHDPSGMALSRHWPEQKIAVPVGMPDACEIASVVGGRALSASHHLHHQLMRDPQ